MVWLFFILPPLIIGAIIAFGLLYWHSSEPPVALKTPVEETTAPPEEQASVQEIVEDPNAPRIYLTFDDGPSQNSTPRILEILATYDLRATFFVLGYMAETYPDLIRAQSDAGHVIANHGYSHDYGVLYASTDSFMANIEQCESVLTGILGQQPPRITRFPAGSAAVQLDNDPAMREAIKARLVEGGWRYFDWNVSMGDSILEAPSPGELGSRLIAMIDEQIAYGSTDIVVLAHDVDAKPWTPIDLPMVIEHCLNSGYVFKVLTHETPPVEQR